MHLHELCDVVVAVASCVGVRGRKRREERGDEMRRSFGLGVACDINHCILRPRVLVVVVSRDSLAPLVAKSPTSFCWRWWRRWLFLSLSAFAWWAFDCTCTATRTAIFSLNFRAVPPPTPPHGRLLLSFLFCFIAAAAAVVIIQPPPQHLRN